MVKVIKFYFLTFVSISIANTNNLYAALQTPLKDHGAVILGLSFKDPLLLCLELTMGQGEFCQHPLQHWGEPFAHSSNVNRVEEVDKQLEVILARNG
jgi:hypothetical protein